MKRIALLTCPKAENVCTGGGCFAALNSRTKAFTLYKGEDVEVLAFMKCSGCGHFPGEDAGLDEKIQYLLNRHPDVVHLGICCCHDGRQRERCREIAVICQIFEKHGISIMRGTHSVF